MNWAWCFGMIVLSGVPAIVGGGITFGLTNSWSAVIGWEAILFCLVVTAITKGLKNSKVDVAKAEAAHAVVH